jgi:hypothetical protein
MPPAFALSQDQTLRFIQASLQSIHPTATPKRTSKGSSLSPKNSQPTSNNQAPSRNTQNKYPQRSTRPGADRASHPATHRNKAKHTATKPSTQPSKDSQALSTSKKTRCNCQTTKKEPATEHLTASHIAGPLNHTDHRQGKNTSQNKTASQAQKTTTNTVNGLLVPPQKHVKRGRKCRPGASKITNPLF